MQVDFENEKPIFVQIAEGIEDAIVTGAFPEESRIPSITEFSVSYKINPATALKGINILVDSGIVYKKRGVGMFVAEGAKEKLTIKRRDAFFRDYVKKMLTEADRLGISKEDIIKMLKENE
jgi:DNA-binding transcriptional regulator YhcF (GntR family)